MNNTKQIKISLRAARIVLIVKRLGLCQFLNAQRHQVLMVNRKYSIFKYREGLFQVLYEKEMPIKRPSDRYGSGAGLGRCNKVSYNFQSMYVYQMTRGRFYKNGVLVPIIEIGD